MSVRFHAAVGFARLLQGKRAVDHRLYLAGREKRPDLLLQPSRERPFTSMGLGRSVDPVSVSRLSISRIKSTVTFEPDWKAI